MNIVPETLYAKKDFRQQQKNVSSPCKRNILGRDIKQRNSMHFRFVILGVDITMLHFVYYLHIRAKHLNTFECINKDYTAKTFFTIRYLITFFDIQNIISKTFK